MSSLRWSRVCGQKAAFPSCCGNVVVWTSACEDTERRESGLSYTPPPGQTGQGDNCIHTHNLRCVRKWHQSGCPDPHTCTLCHSSLISAVPAAPYRNRISAKLGVSLRNSPPPICIVYNLSVKSNNHLFFVKECKVLIDYKSFLTLVHVFMKKMSSLYHLWTFCKEIANTVI